MEAIGLLAGGIADDFYNLVRVISGYSDLLHDLLFADESLRKHVEQIKIAGDRASALTRQLLAFSRQQVLRTVVLDLNNAVTDLLQMLPRLIGEAAALEMFFTASPIDAERALRVGLIDEIDKDPLAKALLNGR